MRIRKHQHVACEECTREYDKALDAVHAKEHELDDEIARTLELNRLLEETRRLVEPYRIRSGIDQYLEHRDEEYRFSRLDELDATSLDQAGEQ